jgi:hypothetical protein
MRRAPSGAVGNSVRLAHSDLFAVKLMFVIRPIATGRIKITNLQLRKNNLSWL